LYSQWFTGFYIFEKVRSNFIFYSSTAKDPKYIIKYSLIDIIILTMNKYN